MAQGGKLSPANSDLEASRQIGILLRSFVKAYYGVRVSMTPFMRFDDFLKVY